MDARATGPESYFPSIEAKYGRTIAAWKALMRASGLTKHGDLVAWLKREHGFGHGHATALVGHMLGEGAAPRSPEEQIHALFPPAKAQWRPVYDTLASAILGFGEVRVLPKASAVGFAARAQFAILQPATADRFDVDLKLPDTEPTARLRPAPGRGGMMTHRVSLTSAEQADSELMNWLRRAYEAAREPTRPE